MKSAHVLNLAPLFGQPRSSPQSGDSVEGCSRSERIPVPRSHRSAAPTCSKPSRHAAWLPLPKLERLRASALSRLCKDICISLGGHRHTPRPALPVCFRARAGLMECAGLLRPAPGLQRRLQGRWARRAAPAGARGRGQQARRGRVVVPSVISRQQPSHRASHSETAIIIPLNYAQVRERERGEPASPQQCLLAAGSCAPCSASFAGSPARRPQRSSRSAQSRCTGSSRSDTAAARPHGALRRPAHRTRTCKAPPRPARRSRPAAAGASGQGDVSGAPGGGCLRGALPRPAGGGVQQCGQAGPVSSAAQHSSLCLPLNVFGWVSWLFVEDVNWAGPALLWLANGKERTGTGQSGGGRGGAGGVQGEQGRDLQGRYMQGNSPVWLTGFSMQPLGWVGGRVSQMRLG